MYDLKHSFQLRAKFFIVILFIQKAIWAQPNGAQMAPQINSDNMVTFRFTSKASNVVLQGYAMLSSLKNIKKDEIYNGISMEKKQDDVWSIAIGPLNPDLYMYNFKVDGISELDPSNKSVYYGSDDLSNIFSIPEKDSLCYWEMQDVPHGTIHHHYYFSKIMGTFNDFYVYTPPQYENESAKYPVLYLLNGRSENASAWISGGVVNIIADNLIAKNKAVPMIIVMPYCRIINSKSIKSKDMMSEFTSNFENELFNSIIPTVESKYRTYKDRGHRAMAGFSFGGALTDKVALNHLDKFSYIGIFSAGLQNFKSEHRDLLNNPDSTNKQIKYLCLAAGSNDIHGPGGSSIEGLRALDILLTQKRIDHTFFELPCAGHTWNAWRYYLNYKFMPFLWK